MFVYSNKVSEHFASPRNAGVLHDANAVGQAGAIAFGAALRLMLKVEPGTGVIAEARFQSFGCGSLIACCSALTEMVTGEGMDQALSIAPSDIAAFLGGLQPEKMYCAVVACEALQRAIREYRGESGRGGEAQLVCKCLGIEEDLVARAVRMNRLTTPEQVSFYTRAGDCCLSCFKRVEALLAKLNLEMAEKGLIAKGEIYRVGSATPRFSELVPRGNAGAMPDPIAVNALAARLAPRPSPPRPAGAPAKRKFVSERDMAIDAAIEDLRPYLQRDGGDCELVEVEGNTVHVRLSGACIGCQMASVTLNGVQEKLAHKLGMPLRVVPVQ